MPEFIIDGCHFSAILQAIDFMLHSQYRVKDVELSWDESERIYKLRARTTPAGYIELTTIT
jgi:hypothetical protein